MRALRLIAAAATFCLATSAMATGETVLVAGATGKTGAPLIRILQAQGYTVRAMVRDRAKAGDLGAGVEIVEADVTRAETLAAAAKGAAYVISAIGASSATPPNNPENVDYKGIANLADAARAASARHFVLMSSIGSGDANPATPLNKVFGMVLMWKGKGEEHLRQSGVPYTIVRPGGLVDCESGKVGLNIAPGDSRVSGRICRADVALVMADALTNPAAAGKTIALIGDDKAPLDAWKSAWAGIARD
jgi:uncharacterized protein YbjT (DUF2867 family)